MNNYVNINGKLVASGNAAVPADNRAFRYGHGLFETMLVRNGDISLSDYHWRRLFQGLGQLHIRLPGLWSSSFLHEEILKTLRKNKSGPLARVRLQVWDGNGGLFEHGSPPQFLIECFPLEETIAGFNENGLVAGIAQGLQKSNDDLANLKSCNAMIYAVAARQAKANKWNDALILNTHGHIIESTIANIFWIKNGQIFTPPLTEGCVAGTMRQYLLDFLPSVQLPVFLKACTQDDLAAADETFLTNAIRKIKWVREINGKIYENKVVSKISSLVSGSAQM